ncbi:MAG: hypothetical protein WEE89_12030 [Gemmatimonadota bacterium]
MNHALTITLDLQTLNPLLPLKLLNFQPLVPGAATEIPGGVMVFQAAFLNSTAGEPSMYRFILQSGAQQAVAAVGNWLYSQLHGTAAALQISGQPVPINHHNILAALERSA